MSHTELLRKITSGGADPQAVLFYGADGVQLEQLATELSAFWIGSEPLDFRRHVDFQKIEPIGAGKQIPVKAIHRTKNQSGEEEEAPWVPAVDFFRTLPLMAKKKVIWFVEAERMNGSACNAFLKTLEELPPHARVILTTLQFSRILPTIRSRCLCVACGTESWKGDALASEMERTWVRNPGELSCLRDHAELFSAFWELLEGVPDAPIAGALVISERTVKKSSDFAKAAGIGNREAQVFFLDLIGRWWLKKYPEMPSIPAECSAIAREILGYSNGQLGFDTLFGTMLAYKREPIADNGR